MSATFALRAAEGADLEYVERVLAASDLPTRDLRDGEGSFYVATAGGDRVGVGGLEGHGSVGLLRSVAVEKPYRGEGYGAAVCDELEARARGRGIDALYLLTTTASGFFAERGYRRVDREAVPPAIRGTTEFAGLCPSSATCMAKELGERE